ncbi:hypothetical protein SAMN05216302_10219 [Nitrosomonas aestuarii]|uniref:Uncharacterized protein n=1 Tax=Nitrosomonas aestuarii TaxID=52441 RepID=A0A1I4DEQ9_9PROT|nr:hypothetical protein [Nitrosomonas aestuarii]SFK91942.1 hypothetical protein SAMN05216302_10219 [Nitrosomonas aestuarii]
MQVKAYIPIEITDARFVSSTIAEPDPAEPEWLPGGTYNTGEDVSVIATDSHLVFQSLVDGNNGNPPATSPTKWILKGKTNRFKMFDWNKATPSVGASPVTVVVRPGRVINAITLEGIKATNAKITVQNGIGGTVVLSIDKNLLARHATNTYEYFYAPFVYDEVLSTYDVPPVADPVVTITLTDPSGTCELGRFATGQAINLGEVEWDTVSEDENNSGVTFDDFGYAELNPVPSNPQLDMEIELESKRVNRVRQFKRQANAKAVVWSGMQDVDAYREMHTIIGVYQRFEMTARNHKYAKFDLSLKGI